VSAPPLPLLVLEAATAAGSVALFTERGVAERAVRMGASREDLLLPAIDELCRELGTPAGTIRSVLCGEGPGSFTSLRIAASTAKGIVHATGAEFYAVSSLLIAATSIDIAGEYLLHSDAMRGERFVQHVVISADGFASARGAVFRAPGNDMSQHLPEMLRALPRVAVNASYTGADDVQVVTPSSARVLRIIEWQQNGRVDLATWEPQYGRLAEAQVKWESAHGTPLPTGAV